MGLERRNGRVYYYTSHRVGGRVRKRYRGADYPATLMAKMDAIDRGRNDFAAGEKQERLCKWQKRFARLRAALARANEVVAAALRAAGWHQHKREWRKRRGAAVATDLATVIGTWTPGGLETQAGALAADVSEKAAKGDRSALPAVRQYLDNPAAVALWGDAGRNLLVRWVKLYARGDLLIEEAISRRAQALRDGLSGPQPGALEALLAERVVLAWVALGVVESWQTRAFESLLDQPPPRDIMTLLNIFPAHVEHAHRQLMAACRTLAKVRRAKLPDVLALVNVSPTAPNPHPGAVKAATEPLR